MIDLENYIETQSKILTSETLALQTIRNNGLSAAAICSPMASEAIASGSLANQKRPRTGEFLGSLSVKRVPNSRLMTSVLNPPIPARGAHRQRAYRLLHRAKFPQ